MAMAKQLVLDTSVWINLLATEEPWTILDALGAHCLAPEQVVSEVKRNPITQNLYVRERHPLRIEDRVEIIELKGETLEFFLSLVSQDSSDSLGDGEAATIAVALARQCAVAIDERKARRIIRERFPGIPVLMTVDILRDPTVKAHLGGEACEAAFAKASQFGRMHVPKSG